MRGTVVVGMPWCVVVSSAGRLAQWRWMPGRGRSSPWHRHLDSAAPPDGPRRGRGEVAQHGAAPGRENGSHPASALREEAPAATGVDTAVHRAQPPGLAVRDRSRPLPTASSESWARRHHTVLALRDPPDCPIQQDRVCVDASSPLSADTVPNSPPLPLSFAGKFGRQAPLLAQLLQMRLQASAAPPGAAPPAPRTTRRPGALPQCEVPPPAPRPAAARAPAGARYTRPASPPGPRRTGRGRGTAPPGPGRAAGAANPGRRTASPRPAR